MVSVPVCQNVPVFPHHSDGLFFLFLVPAVSQNVFRSVPDVPVCPLLHEPVFRFLLPVSLYEPVFLHHSDGSVLLPGVFHHRLDDPGSVPDVPVPDVFPAVCCCSLNSVGELQMQDFSSLEHPLFLLFYLQPSQHLCQLLLF